MASGPITSWQIDVKKVETMSDFIFLGSKITVDCNCSHEIKRHLAPWKKSYDKPRQCIKKQRHHIADKGPVCIVKTMVSPVVMSSGESWTVKKAEHQIIDAFELWCGRRLLWVLWIAWRSNQPILKESNHEYLLEGVILKLQYFGHLLQRTDPLEKTLMLGKTEGRKRRGQQRMRWLEGITDSMDDSMIQWITWVISGR